MLPPFSGASQNDTACNRKSIARGLSGSGPAALKRLPSTGSEGSGALHVLASGNVFPVPELVGVPLGPVRVLPAVLARVRDQPVVLLAASGLGSPAEVQCQAPAVVRGAVTSGEARFAGGDGDLRLQRAVGIGDGEVLSGVLLERRVHLREGDRGIGPQLVVSDTDLTQPFIGQKPQAADRCRGRLLDRKSTRL